jgi:hypothetical protein
MIDHQRNRPTIAGRGDRLTFMADDAVRAPAFSDR